MSRDMLDLLVSIHHQLSTDSDLESVTCPEKYSSLVRRIEGVLIQTEYHYLCTHLEDARVVRETVTLNAGRDLGEYLRLKRAGYTTLWSGQGKICLEKPAIVHPADIQEVK